MAPFSHPSLKTSSGKRQELIHLTDDEADHRLALGARALGHPARVKILRQLLTKNQCLCGDFVRALPWAQSTISQHLKALKEAGLIRGRGEGNTRCYCVDQKNLTRLKILLSALA